MNHAPKPSSQAVGPAVESVARTDVGCVRRRNEDAVLSCPPLGLWAVADGLGGHSAGDVASRLIVERLGALEPRAGIANRVDAVEECLSHVNTELRLMAAERGVGIIGSTVVVLVAGDGLFLCGWAGDSRGYVLADDLRPLTRDHVYLGLGSESGNTAALAGSLALTRAVGAEETLSIDWTIAPGEAVNAFLLCSDGINKEIEDRELAALLTGKAPAQAADELMALALARGARDNISAVLVGLDPAGAAQGPLLPADAVQRANVALGDAAEAHRQGRLGKAEYIQRRRSVLQGLLSGDAGTGREHRRDTPAVRSVVQPQREQSRLVWLSTAAALGLLLWAALRRWS